MFKHDPTRTWGKAIKQRLTLDVSNGTLNHLTLDGSRDDLKTWGRPDNENACHDEWFHYKESGLIVGTEKDKIDSFKVIVNTCWPYERFSTAELTLSHPLSGEIPVDGDMQRAQLIDTLHLDVFDTDADDVEIIDLAYIGTYLIELSSFPDGRIKTILVSRRLDEKQVLAWESGGMFRGIKKALVSVYDMIKAWGFLAAVVVTIVVSAGLPQKAWDGLKTVLMPSYYGEVLITSQVPGLSIIINENVVGTTQIGESLSYQFRHETGSGGFGWHDIVFQKDIDENTEYYLVTECHFTDEELEKKEVETIDVIAPDYDYIKNKDYKASSHRIAIRTKRDVLRKQTGLLKEVKLKHNGAYSMTQDNGLLYVVSRAYTSMYRKSRRENQDWEYMEVFDLKTLQLADEIELGFNDDLFGRYTDIDVGGDFIYVGTREPDPRVEFSPKNDRFKTRREHLETAGHTGKINAVRTYEDYVFAADEGGSVSVYKNNRFLYAIETKPLDMDHYQKLENKEFGAIFDLLVHDGNIYISNDRETVYIYALNDEKPEPLGGFDRLRYNEDTDEYYVFDIQDMLIYKDRFLLFPTEYSGLSCYDTLDKKMVYEHKNLYPKSTYFSEMFKEEIDDTKRTDIYKMVLYKDYLIFTEVADRMGVYDFEKGRLVHTFEGASDDIFDLEVYEDQLISLSCDGVLYIWDLTVLGK